MNLGLFARAERQLQRQNELEGEGGLHEEEGGAAGRGALQPQAGRARL